MDDLATNIIYFDGTDYYPILSISLKSIVNTQPLKDIVASRATGKKVKPWVPQEENSIYISPPVNTMFIANSEKLKEALSPGINTLHLPTRSLNDNLFDLHVSWHGNEGRLHIKGRKDTTFELQTSSEYTDDIVPSIKRVDMAGVAHCIIEVVIPVNTKSFQKVTDYKEPSSSFTPIKLKPNEAKNQNSILEHPCEIILDKQFGNKTISLLFYVHIGTSLAPWTVERVQKDLIAEPLTITNTGYKGAVNSTILIRDLGDIDDITTNPIVFMLKSTDHASQVYFEAIKYSK